MKRMMLSLVAVLAAGAAQAGECAYPQCWGAVGFDDAGYGVYTFGNVSEDVAWQTVLDSCGGSCPVVQTFHSTCGAMARASDGAWGWATGGTREAAEWDAIQYCSDYGPNCDIIAWACSP